MLLRLAWRYSRRARGTVERSALDLNEFSCEVTRRTMAPEKAPAFQFYPKDWETDLNVVPMTYEEEGVYFDLCRKLWMHKRLPSDLDQLRRLLKGNPTLRQMQAWWKKIGPCFTERNGLIFHKRIEIERRKQAARRKAQRANGLKGGRPKATGLPKETQPKALHLLLPTAVDQTPLPPKGGSRRTPKKLQAVIALQPKPEAVDQALETRRRRTEMAELGMTDSEIESVFEREYEARRRA